MNHCAETSHYTNFRKKLPILFFGILNAVLIALVVAGSKWYLAPIIIAPYFIYFSMKNPFILPFGLYVILIPFDSILDIIGFAQGATLTKLLGILTISVLSLKGFFEKKFIQPTSVSLTLTLLVAYCFMTNVWAIRQGAVFSQLPTLVGLLVFYLIASSYKIQAREFDALTWCILFGGILASALTFYSFENGLSFEHTRRATVTLWDDSINPNVIGISLLMPLSICLRIILASHRKMLKILLLCTFLFMSYVVIITGSRKALIGVAIILAVYNSHIKHKMTFSTLALVAIAALLLIAPDYLTERVASSLADRGAGRLDIWDVAIVAVKQYWLLGAGLGNFPLAFNKFMNEGGGNFVGFARDAHNIYLMFLVETGIIGLSLLLWTFKKHYNLLKPRFVSDDLNVVMLRASFWSILFVGFFANIFLAKSFWLMLMMIAMYRNVHAKRNGVRFFNSRLNESSVNGIGSPNVTSNLRHSK
jgi:O-antigen ligase